MYHKSEFYNKGMLSAHPETSMIRTGEPGAGASVLAAGIERFALSSRSPPETVLSGHALPGAWPVSLAQSSCVHVDVWGLLRQPRPSGQGRAIGHISRDRSSLTLAQTQKGMCLKAEGFLELEGWTHSLACHRSQGWVVSSWVSLS